MQRYIKEVGRGKKGSKDLTREEAAHAAELIISGQATAAQIGAFLLAERVKSETTDELLSFIESYRKSSQLIEHSHPLVLDTAGPYDGRTKTFVSTISTSVVVASAGGRVIMHGSPTLPPKNGIVIQDILQALGIQLEQTAEAGQAVLQEIGICAVNTESFCPPLGRLRAIREQLGVRTLFNTVEKALNFGNATHSIIGVFHTSALEKAVELQQNLPIRRSLVVQGTEGSEDVPLHRKSKICLIEKGSVSEIFVDPRSLGLYEEAKDVQLSPQDHAEHTLRILQGKEDPYASSVFLNSAIKLWLCELVPDIDSGLARAKQILASGQATAILEKWRKCAS